MSAFRAYFYDLDSRKEIKDFDGNGKTWLGSGGFARDSQGRYIKDTTTSVEIADYADLCNVKGRRVVTAKDFPGRRVAVKIWFGPDSDEKPEWRKLVQEGV